MSSKNANPEHVKTEVNTARKMTQHAFDAADQLFAHLDRIKLDLADSMDFSTSANDLRYGYAPFEGIRISFYWLNRPWLQDSTLPKNRVSWNTRSRGIPTLNPELAGQGTDGLLRYPVTGDAYCDHAQFNWYVSMDAQGGYLQICLPRCVFQSAKYLRKIKAMLRQPAWYGSMSDETGYCSYTDGWFGMLDGSGSRGLAPELFNPGEHFWYTGDRPYAEGNAARMVPQTSLGFGSIFASKGPTSEDGNSRGYFTADDGLWKMREWARMSKKAYEPLPERVLDALDMQKLAHCYPHLALQDGHTGMIAYTRDENGGANDRQLVMKPGRFIRQFARNGGISDDEVKYLAAEAVGTVEIKFHATSERKEIARVYQRGPQSCMAYGPLAKEQFDGDHLEVNGEFVHPCEIYAHPENNLELRYGTLGEGKDNVVSLVMTNTRDMTYCSIYVKDSPASAREQMEQHLKKQGFKYSDQVLQGQKLLLIETDDRSIISPYLDPSNVGVRLDRANCCLVAGEGGYGANHATGTLNDFTGGSREDDWSCECCGDDYADDDDSEYDHHGCRICRGCIDSSYTYVYCTNNQEEAYVRDSETIYDCEHVTRGLLEHYSYVYFNGYGRGMQHYDCVELDSERYSSRMIAHEDDCAEDDDGNYVLRDDLDDYDLFVDDDGDAHPIDEWVAVTDEDGDVKLLELDDLDEDLYDKAPSSHADWPMLDFYTLKAEADEDEDDEPVNVLTDDECPDQSVA